MAVAALQAGNARFAASQRTLSTDTHHDGEFRHRLVKGQHPLASILCCADSRICPEFIFDQHVGSLFEIRNAGNVVDEDVLASMEYAVEHLHVPVILVMGHEGCGAMAAVSAAGDQPLPHHLKALQEHTRDLGKEIGQVHDEPTPEHLNGLSLDNAQHQALRLVGESEVIRDAVHAGQVQVLFGLYALDTGCVEFHDLKVPTGK
jgi:carbonic anhydrase